MDELQTELDEGSRRGSALLRDAVAQGKDRREIRPEIDLVALFQAARIPNVHYNVRLVDASGQFIAIADAWLDDVGLAVEVDSVEYHGAGAGFAGTVRRNWRYARAGVPVLYDPAGGVRRASERRAPRPQRRTCRSGRPAPAERQDGGRGAAFGGPPDVGVGGTWRCAQALWGTLIRKRRSGSGVGQGCVRCGA